MKDKKIIVNMAALNPYVEDNIVKPTEKEIRNQGFISWGDSNDYPQYLNYLYENVPTLQAIVDSYVTYILGDEVKSNSILVSDRNAYDLVDAIAFSYVLYGGFALNIIRNKAGEVSRIYPLDFKCLRSDEKNDNIFYSKDFGCKSYGRGKYIAYPSFNLNGVDASSIFYFKNQRYRTYPLPMWASAASDCEIEKKISTYHLNSLNNNFVGSVFFNFNNGVPSDEVKDEIVRDLEEKYTGVENSSRIVVSFNESKDHAATIEKIDTEDYAERYKALAETTRSRIFTAFKCTPNLIGLPTETTGFNSQEYESAFKLFNRTQIAPIQREITKALDDILGEENSITITPFSIKFEEQ